MKTFTEFYLDRITDALIDRAMEKGKWMTQAEVERMHQMPYRGGVFMVRRRIGHKTAEWRVSWDSRCDGKGFYTFSEAGKAVTAFERVRREVDRRLEVRFETCDGCGRREPVGCLIGQGAGVLRRLCETCDATGK